MKRMIHKHIVDTVLASLVYTAHTDSSSIHSCITSAVGALNTTFCAGGLGLPLPAAVLRPGLDAVGSIRKQCGRPGTEQHVVSYCTPSHASTFAMDCL
jgi:hypothetical protein